MKMENIRLMPERRPNVTQNFEMIIKPPDVHEAHAALTEGIENTWYEYVPKSYTGKKSVPLVVQVHGGMSDGRIWTHFTAWHMVAEQEGFIVVYPNSVHPGFWNCDKQDIDYLAGLIEHLKGKFNIDASRVYMQGMSNGEMMTLAFSMVHPEVLAAAGNITGPSPAELIGDDRPTGELPLLQMRGEKDVFFQLPDPPPEDIYSKRYAMNDLNREIWMGVNGTSGLPNLSVRGKDNFLFFHGHSPIINWEIKGMGHKEPPDGAQVLWDYLYSGCSRIDGKPVINRPNKIIEGDRDSMVVALGSNKVYKGDHLEVLHPSLEGYARSFEPPEVPGKINIGEMFETPGLYIPIEGLQALFGAKTEKVDPGDSAVAVFPDGTRYEFYSNAILLRENGKCRGLRKPSILMAGLFFIPIEEFAGDILGMYTSFNDGVLLISAHRAELGRYTARILKTLM